MNGESAEFQAMQKRDLHLDVEGPCGKILKVEIVDIRVHVTTRIHFEASPLAATPQSDALEFDCRVTVASPEPPEKIANLIRLGENTCFVLQSLLTPVKVNSSTTLNGRPLQVAACTSFSA